MKSIVYHLRIVRSFEVLFTGLSLLFLCGYLVVAVFRLLLPYELTNYEYESLIQVIRTTQLQPIYARPLLEYEPMMYTPFYYYVSALFAVLLGPSLFSLRLVSFIASLCTMIALYIITKKETNSKMCGVIAAGFFAACYEIGGASYEVARVDSLALMFFMMSVFFVRLDKFAHRYLIGGIFFALACFTKQTYLLYLLPVMVLIKAKREVVLFSFISLLLIMIAAVGSDIYSDGWFYYYVVGLPSKHRLHENIFGRILQVVFVYKYFFGLFAVVLLSQMRQKLERTTSFIVATGISIVISFILTLKNGGSNNMMFPAFCLVAIVFSLAVFRSARDMWRVGFINWNSHFMILIMLGIFYALLLYVPQSPTRWNAAKKQWSEAVSVVRSIKGEVFIPSDPWLVYAAGKTPTAHIDLIGDMIGEWGDRQPTREGERIILELQSNIKKKKYSVIALTERDESSILYRKIESDIAQNYTLDSAVFECKRDYLCKFKAFVPKN